MKSSNYFEDIQNANENVLKIDQTILNNGMYLYQVLTNGEVVAADKLIIAK